MQLSSLSVSRRRAIAGVVVLALAVLFVPRLVGQRHATAPPVALVRPAQHSAPASRPQLVVDVAGAVRLPGLHRLQQGTRIADAVAAAGGATAKADLSLVNLAAPLADGEQILVPARGGAGAAAALGGSPQAPLDLNTATPEQLDGLPGIGPATAAKIVDFRQAHGPFRSVDELDAVPGFGPARIEQLKGLVIP
jgi:competence protein ComEA